LVGGHDAGGELIKLVSEGGKTVAWVGRLDHHLREYRRCIPATVRAR
jgi:hypothetical protein